MTKSSLILVQTVIKHLLLSEDLHYCWTQTKIILSTHLLEENKYIKSHQRCSFIDTVYCIQGDPLPVFNQWKPKHLFLRHPVERIKSFFFSFSCTLYHSCCCVLQSDIVSLLSWCWGYETFFISYKGDKTPNNVDNNGDCLEKQNLCRNFDFPPNTLQKITSSRKLIREASQLENQF